jgi:hypothetical protein
VLSVTAVGVGWAGAASAGAAASVSSNWAGYVAVASASVGSHFSSVSDSWSSTSLELQQGAGIGARGPGAFRSVSARTVTLATPSLVSSADGSFAVSWHEQAIQVQPRTAPTFPGFNGGAP